MCDLSDVEIFDDSKSSMTTAVYPRRQSLAAGFSRPFVCFAHDVSKTDAARITKLDIEIFHRESWNYFGVKRSTAVVGLCTVAGAGCLFYMLIFFPIFAVGKAEDIRFSIEIECGEHSVIIRKVDWSGHVTCLWNE